VLGTCIDVTERRRIADELRNLEILWSAMLASMSEQIAIVDRSGSIIAVNDAWSRYARERAERGFPRVSVGTNYLAACQSTGGSKAVQAVEGIAAVLDGSEGEFHLEYDCSCPDAPRWFEFSAVRLHRPEGGAVLLHRDITRRKEAEIEAQEQ